MYQAVETGETMLEHTLTPVCALHVISPHPWGKKKNGETDSVRAQEV